MTDVEIVIAVLTYRRPEDLAGVLDELVEHTAASMTTASIVVVDNDENPSARSIVEARPGVRYVHEPVPGIAAARNRALDEAADDRLLVFIDDDERPAPGWLDSLMTTWRSTGAAAVVGPVISTFATPPDAWIEHGGFFRRLRHATGTRVPVAATNNLLLDLDRIRTWGLRFDDRFGITGGSDYLFTSLLVRHGGEIVWCDEAVVYDVVPPDRATRRWVLQRAVRMGNTAGRVGVLLAEPGLRRTVARCTLIARASARLALGYGRALVGAIARNPTHQARGIRTAARGRGMLLGAIGNVVVEYGRSPKSGSRIARNSRLT